MKHGVKHGACANIAIAGGSVGTAPLLLVQEEGVPCTAAAGRTNAELKAAPTSRSVCVKHGANGGSLMAAPSVQPTDRNIASRTTGSVSVTCTKHGGHGYCELADC